jgi:hypothetical protein
VEEVEVRHRIGRKHTVERGEMEERERGKKRETIRSRSGPMLKPTDTVQRAEAVGRPACSPPVFISSHFGDAPRLVCEGR